MFKGKVMGRLVDGEWVSETKWNTLDGRFERVDASFRNWITATGEAGPTGEGGFAAESGRYHLYVAAACPWAHRTMIFRKLKGLENFISVSLVDPVADDGGWRFTDEHPDHLFGSERLHQVYSRARKGVTSRVSVPVLWDKKRQTIVSNESSEIIRMLNSAFDEIGADASIDFYPPDLRAAIDDINAIVYSNVNDGVYKVGFAGNQAVYEQAVAAIFTTLDMLEERLSDRRYLVGERLTEADWRLFTTLLRFDIVYFGHFKCNIRQIADYPNLSGFLRELYQIPGVRETVDIDAIKRHYYQSHLSINPKGIVPLGPVIDLESPPNRNRLKAA
jgi:putative glutathione S-transferase